MINPKLLKTIASVLSALRPFAFAVVGGLTVATIQRCQKQEPVNLIVTNQQYEKQLSDIRAEQDSLNRALPGLAESLRYLSERYPYK